jgi:hypothetical protein
MPVNEQEETKARPAARRPPASSTDALVVAGRIKRASARRIGLLPVGRRGARKDHTALLAELGAALAAFAEGPVGYLPAWPEWDGAGTVAVPVSPGGADRLYRISPPRAADAEAAGQALVRTLETGLGRLARVLVYLGGYAGPGQVPAAVNALDGVVLLVEARRTLLRSVARVAHQLPEAKNLGAILVG